MTPITANDDAPDDDEYADGEQQMQPSRTVVQHSNDPDENQDDAADNSYIHGLTCRALVSKLPMSETESIARDGELSF